jgi:flagellar FliJ protein
MAFKFQLQAVLEHRRHLEDLAKAEYAEKIGAQNQIKQQIAWLEDEHKRAREEMHLNSAGGMPANDYILANEYATVLRLQSLREQSKLPMLEIEIEAARQKLLEATRNRKVLEKLREKHLARYNKEMLSFEQKLMDEAAVSAFTRRGS